MAGPLVTGSIANVLKITPELSRRHIELMLDKTGIPLGNNPKKTGKLKMLNSYKLVWVAQRLQEELKNKRFKNASERDAFIDSQLANPKIYDFTTAAQISLKKSKETAFLDNCKNLAAAIKLARTSLLLHPTVAAKKHLVHLYNLSGHTQNRDFYKGLTDFN